MHYQLAISILSWPRGARIRLIVFYTFSPIESVVDIGQIIRKYALQNAVQFNGKATVGAVLGKVMAENTELRPRAKELTTLAKTVVDEINKMPAEAQKKALEELAPELLVKESKQRETGLPDLRGVTGEVRMRMAPNPSGPLHVGHSRMAILNDEYVKRYGGICYNRFEDTDPARIDPSGYDTIPEDFAWLGVRIDKTIIQSERFEIYYDIAKNLLEMGKAYVCTCKPETWRDLKNHKKPCPHREQPLSEQMLRWDLLFDGSYKPEEASLMVKTDLMHPNPAIRDFVGLRIDDTPHPRTGTKYRVYPLMNLAVAVDDHLLDLTHVLRGKDHLNNTFRQQYLYDYFGWKKPVYIHYGRVSIEDAQLSTSKMANGIREGLYSGWDDPQLGTLRALKRRGIRPESLRRYWLETGIKEVDIEFSWKTLYSFNRELIDDSADRFFFVSDPVKVKIEGAPDLVSKAPVHPDHPERGIREIRIGPKRTVYVSRDDVPKGDGKLRLKDLGNIEFKGGVAHYIGNDLGVLKEGVPIAHWAPLSSFDAEVLMTDGTAKKGKAEPLLAAAKGKLVQLERFAFVRVEEVSPIIRCVFAHR
ncbi:MAG: glutamate--tRNA ligase [Candidatus Thermoplasmatota archaeon]|nr:glutamate--tRNA ligase [Candidatus Thermoplasmatota archaeon]